MSVIFLWSIVDTRVHNCFLFTVFDLVVTTPPFLSVGRNEGREEEEEEEEVENEKNERKKKKKKEKKEGPHPFLSSFSQKVPTSSSYITVDLIVDLTLDL